MAKAPSSSNLNESIADLIQFCLGWAMVFMRRFGLTLAIAFALGLLVYLAAADYLEKSTRNIEFQIGSWTGSSRDQAQLIQEQAKLHFNEFGRRYTLDLRGTGGFEENRRKISQDLKGDSIGFVHEGLGDSAKLRMLLPLEWNYLHILCSTRGRLAAGELANELNSNAKLSLTNTKIADYLQSTQSLGRVYLGPQGSGTRQLAELVLQQHGFDPDQLSAHGIQDWDEMRAALAIGSIDIAFFAGPLNNKVIEKIAQKRIAVLVGLDGVADAIVQQNEFLAKEDFKKDCYRVGGFCPDQLSTVASRRVLVSSAAMSEGDAFSLARAAVAALRGSVNIDMRTLSPTARTGTNRDFAIGWHPGAKLLQEGTKPTNWLAKYAFLVTPVAVFFCAELLRWLRPPMPNTPPEKPADKVSIPMVPVPESSAVAEKDDAYIRFFDKIDTQCEEMADLTLSEARKRRTEWLQATRELRQQIDAASRNKTLSPMQWRELRGMLATLRDKIQKLRESNPLSRRAGK